MKKTIHSLTLGLTLALGVLPNAFAQGTMFTYQGRVTDNGAPGQVDYDFRFTLCGADSQPVAGAPVKEMTVPLKNGLFKADLDFGAGMFTGDKRLLQVEMKLPTESPASYKKMLPLQELAAAPYALYAGTVKTVPPNSVDTAQLVNSAVKTDQLGQWAVTKDKIKDGEVVKSLNAMRDDVTLTPGNNITITPNVGAKTIEIAVSGVAPPGWNLTGNAGTTPGTHYLGTPDLTPLEFKVNGARALKLGTNNNFIAGSPYNSVRVGAYGASIGGGGSSHTPNVVLESSGTIGGGQGNSVHGNGATVGGGYSNNVRTNADYATIGGGYDNDIGTNALSSVIGGGENNSIGTWANHATIAGGHDNVIESVGVGSAIGGGFNNRVTRYFATIPGGVDNVADGIHSFAAGRRAKANHTGSFVWADSTDADFASTAANQFSIRASGGLRLNTDTSMYFGSDTRQMLNLWSTSYGIGVQSSTEYFRSSGGFAWFGAGVHSDTKNDPGAGGSRLMLLSSAGNLSVKSITINGGMDLAEPFAMSSNHIPRGAVVVIDEEHPGQLTLSDRAYDHRVAGIVSGANGINPGISLHQDGVVEGGQNVALNGRVYVQADATREPIKPGDLLTTSDVPGHAMKATDRDQAQGAILGKAMTPLVGGKGMVLVLVSLQ